LANELLPHRLDVFIEEHIRFLGLQIDSLLERNIPVIVMTPLPVLFGQLPWSQFDENNNLVWEEGRWCNYNQGL
jgi:hypothetical protein